MINVPKSESSLTVTITPTRAKTLIGDAVSTAALQGRSVYDIGDVKLVVGGEYAAVFGAESDVLALLDN